MYITEEINETHHKDLLYGTLVIHETLFLSSFVIKAGRPASG